VHAIDPGPLSNKLMAALPRNDYQLILPHLSSEQLAQGYVLCEAGTEVDQVYFPLSGMVSNGKLARSPERIGSVSPEGRSRNIGRAFHGMPDWRKGAISQPKMAQPNRLFGLGPTSQFNQKEPVALRS
jgi:hypothetical protein